MVITEGHPESWEDEAWEDHVLATDNAPDWVISVRNPLPLARIGLAMTPSFPIEARIQAIDQWRIRGEGAVLTVVSLQTTVRHEGFLEYLDSAVLRFAREKAIANVQCIVPIAIANAKAYTPMTRLQLVLWDEVWSELSQALIKLDFKPVVFRPDPIGIDIGFVWENPFR